jgi:hypothetical protein
LYFSLRLILIFIFIFSNQSLFGENWGRFFFDLFIGFVFAQGSELLFAQVQSKDKEFKQYEGGEHDLMHDPRLVKTIRQDRLAWLNKRLK